MKKTLLLSVMTMVLGICISGMAYSQPSENQNNSTNSDLASPAEILSSLYTFTYSTGTYTDLVGATNLSTGVLWDYTVFPCPIGFSFKFFTVLFDTAWVSDPNDIQFGPVMGKYFITAYGSDLSDRAFGDGSGKPKSPISYIVADTAPNRILKIEWKNAGFLSEITDSNTWTNFINLQLWLYETTNNIEIHYGPSLITYKHLAYPGNPGPNVSLNNNVSSKYISLIGDSTSPTSSTLPEQYLTGTPPNGTIYKFSSGYVNIGKNEKDQYLMYPNPVINDLNILLPRKYDLSIIHVFNTLGEETMKAEFRNTNLIQLNLSSLKKGTYLLKLQNSETTIITKFVK